MISCACCMEAADGAVWSRGFGRQGDLSATLQVDPELGCIGTLGEEHQGVENGRHDHESGDQPPRSELASGAWHVGAYLLMTLPGTGSAACRLEVWPIVSPSGDRRALAPAHTRRRTDGSLVHLVDVGAALLQRRVIVVDRLDVLAGQLVVVGNRLPRPRRRAGRQNPRRHTPGRHRPGRRCPAPGPQPPGPRRAPRWW